MHTRTAGFTSNFQLPIQELLQNLIDATITGKVCLDSGGIEGGICAGSKTTADNDICAFLGDKLNC